MRAKILASVGFFLVAGTFHAVRAAYMEGTTASDQEQVKRGSYLVTYGGCNDCHTPKLFTDQGPRPDASRLLAGYPEGKKLPEVPKDVIGPARWGGLASDDLTAWVGPWGISFASNLTPDKETGLGKWTPEKFMAAMRTGRHEGEGRAILPPMPWYGMAPMSEEDLRAIFAYLQSLKPVKNKVPEPVAPAHAP